MFPFYFCITTQFVVVLADAPRAISSKDGFGTVINARAIDAGFGTESGAVFAVFVGTIDAGGMESGMERGGVFVFVETIHATAIDATDAKGMFGLWP